MTATLPEVVVCCLCQRRMGKRWTRWKSADGRIACSRCAYRPSIFVPDNVGDIEARLRRIEENVCYCATGPHEDALHDLAADDVPWLLAEVRRLRRNGAR